MRVERQPTLLRLLGVRRGIRKVVELSRSHFVGSRPHRVHRNEKRDFFYKIGIISVFGSGSRLKLAIRSELLKFQNYVTKWEIESYIRVANLAGITRTDI